MTQRSQSPSATRLVYGLIGLVVSALLVASSSAGFAQSIRRTPVVEVVERVAPAVVNISAESMVREVDPFFGNFFPPRQRRSQSLGSGLIINSSGVVVTNAHVIDGASKIVITTQDGRKLEADVLGSDKDSDLAVLKVAANGLPAVELGRSDDLLIGETVLAIGNPFGLAHTVTSGVLSGRGRSLPTDGGDRVYTDFLQTDASINPGNSGGPLVNLEGKVIGINTAIFAGANNIGFAIPVDRAERVVGDLLRYGELKPLWTGLRLLTVDPEMAQRSGFEVDQGVMALKVYPRSPAARAGFEEGDLIEAINGTPIGAREDLTTALYTIEIGERVRCLVRRGERSLELELPAERPPEGLGLELLLEGIGLVARLERGHLAIEQVVAGSAAAEKGLRQGDRLLQANGQRLETMEDLSRETLRGVERGGLLLTVQRGRYAYHLSFGL